MEKSKTKKRATVKKILHTVPEKAQIDIEDADDLYREIRIENTLEDEKGKKVKLKEGADIEVIVEADSKATLPKETD